MGKSVPFLEILDLSEREVERSGGILHFFDTTMIDLSRFDPEISNNLVLCFDREVGEELGIDNLRIVSIEILEPHPFKEISHFIFRRDSGI